MCCQAEWPVYDASKTVASTVEMAIQVNGKMKGTVTMPVDSDEETVKAAALTVDKVQKATEGMQIVKTILVEEPAHQPDRKAPVSTRSGQVTGQDACGTGETVLFHKKTHSIG